MSTWATQSHPTQLHDKDRPKGDKAPKALACYGAWMPKQRVSSLSSSLDGTTSESERIPEQMLLRFVDGRPVSEMTCAFLAWLAETLASQEDQTKDQAKVRALVLFWDNASWHESKTVRQWLRDHNRSAKKSGGLRLLICRLPKRSPWLNNIEPKWAHGKRAVVEPEGVLSPEQLIDRLCRYYRCEKTEPLKQITHTLS